MTTAQQVLDIARSQIGYSESPPDSNDTKYGASFGENGVPWCCQFLWWIEAQADVQLPVKTASVYALMGAFKAAGTFYPTPEPGDIVFYNYLDGHAEIVESVAPTTITTIGGNTTSTNGSEVNGGEVARKVRQRSSSAFPIFGYGRPNYTATPQEDDMPPTFTVTCPTGGYWVVRRADGGVYSYGGSPSFGSMSGKPMNTPVAALGAHTTNGVVDGYWLLGEDGGVFALGSAPYTDSYAAHPEWHAGNRYMADIVQHGGGYDIIAIEVGTDPPKPDIYDLSVRR